MAYVIKKKSSNVTLPYLPVSHTLKNGQKVVLDKYRDSDETEMYNILKFIVNEEGNSYPQDDMSSIEDFRNYYLSHDVFVCRDAESQEVLGGFYIKPNFPGRCSHICNAGFITRLSSRNLGLGTFFMKQFLQMARDLGYLSVMFNLVFETNEASVRLCRNNGLEEIGKIPKAGNLKGQGFTDAYQFFYDLTKISKKVPE